MALDPVAEHVLTTYKTWAVVGLSPDRTRDSHGVALTLQRRGYSILGVNPAAAGTEILGAPVYATLDEAIAIGAKAVWMQLGVYDDEACERARAAGLEVVMDRCPKIDLSYLPAA